MIKLNINHKNMQHSEWGGGLWAHRPVPTPLVSQILPCIQPKETKNFFIYCDMPLGAILVIERFHFSGPDRQ